MNRGKEETIIDLTDDTPNESTSAVPVIEFVGETRTHTQPPGRRESTNSDVVIVEDDEPTVEDELPMPEVACHFFYPCEDEGGEGQDPLAAGGSGGQDPLAAGRSGGQDPLAAGRSGGQDPLAPLPEWVDCSTMHSDQLTLDGELVLETSPQQSANPCAYVDPLSMAVAIKTEPGTEDVKPSLAQLSQMASARNRDSCLSENFNRAQKTNLVIKQEPLNDTSEFVSNDGSKRKNSQDIDQNCTLPPKKMKTGMKVGPKCAQFRHNEKKISTSNINVRDQNLQNNYESTSPPSNGGSKRKNSQDIDQNCTLPPKKMKTGMKVGPKCAQFRHNEKKISTSNINVRDQNLQNNYESTSPPKSTSSMKKVGPKCAKFRLKDQNTTIETQSKDLPSKIVGPKCAKLRLKEQNTTAKPHSEDLYTKRVGPKCAKLRLKEQNTSVEPSSEDLSKKRVGPKCAKLRLKEQNTSVEPSSEDLSKKRVGPKCAKFRLKDQNTSVEPHSEDLSTKRVGPKCAKLRLKEQNTSVEPSSEDLSKKRVGPKCAKFRLKDQNTSVEPHSEDLSTKRVGPKCAKFRLKEQKTTVEPLSKDLSTKIVGPKCAKLRLKEQKTTVECHSKEIMKDPSIVIKPAVVTIGPKLPLPQCFQRKKSLSEEDGQDTYELTDKSSSKPENHLDKNHIVLKIYTCFNCNHKCTDPLFHEEHVNLCISKRRSTKMLNLPLQDFNKQDGFYKCEICTFKFKIQENLISHLKDHGVRGFVCHICQLTYLTIHQLQQHSMMDHKNLEKVYSCNSCEYSTQNVRHLKDHMVWHNADKHLFCSYCKHNLENEEEIEKHREKFHRRSWKKNEERNLMRQTEDTENKSILRDQQSIKIAENKEQLDSNKAIAAKNCEVLLSDDCLTPTSCDITSPSLETSFEKQIIRRNGAYCCNGCCYKFIHLKNFVKHRKQHLKNKPFRCCNGSFLSLSYIDFAKHAKVKHDESFKFACSMCSQTFTTEFALGRHLVRHVDDGLYCVQCRKNMENVASYESHVSTKHNYMSVAKYNCSKCSFSTHNLVAFKRHLTWHANHKMQSETETHVNSNEGGTNLNEVSKTTKGENKSFNQVESYLSSSAFSCSVCNNYKCCSAVELQEHEVKCVHAQGPSRVVKGSNSVLEDEGFRCNKCTFKCSQPSVYIEHMKRGHNKRKFICNICRSECTLLKYYKVHMMNHAACAVVYSCNECRFTSRKKQIFYKHMRTHTLKRCPQCDYKTMRYDKLKFHLETIHTVENEYSLPWSPEKPKVHDISAVKPKVDLSETPDSILKNDSLKSHDCCFCDYKTTDVHNLRNHVALHFKNSNTENQKQRNKISKSSLTMVRWKNKTLHTKAIGRGIIKASQQRRKTTTNGSFVLYCCTQCEYKKKCRRTVAQHLLLKHNVRGSVRNSTIKKVYVKAPQTKDIETIGDLKDCNLKRDTSFEIKHDYGLSNVSNQVQEVPNETNDIPETDNKSIPVISTEPSELPSLPWECLSCDLQKLPLLAQLQHKKFGHMGFWQRLASCKVCGLRFTSKGYLAKHVKWKHNEIKPVRRKHNEIEPGRRKHNEIEPGRIIVKCPDCHVESFSESAQSQHSKLGHDEFWKRPFSCSVCKKRFLKRGHYDQHRLVHKSKVTHNKGIGAASFKLKEMKKETSSGCEEINVKSGVTSTNLSCSSQDNGNESSGFISDEDENYICGECDFVTTNITKFSTHMFIHSGIPDD